MIARPRVYFALSFLATGVVVAPLISTDSEPIDWRAMAQAYQDPIFSDGFENGSTTNWSVTVNDATVTLKFSQGSPVVMDIVQSVDSFGRAWVPTAILVDQGYNGRGFNAGPNTLVDDCKVTINETGVVIITFLMPPNI